MTEKWYNIKKEKRYSKYGSFGGKASDCTSLLNLNSFSASKNSRASDREVDTAVSFIKNNKYLSTSNSADLINRVLNSGYRSVSTTDTNCNFLLDILGNYDEDFLKDSMLKYNYTQKPSSYTGKNGKQICSKDYMKAIEKEIFGDNLGISMFRVSSSAYINLISKSFDEIEKQIESDLNTGERQNDYLTKENAQNLRDCLKALEKVNVRCYGLYSKVDKLDWFIGGKYDSVLTLQKTLNKLNPMNRLLEDGVYGAKTQSTTIAQVEKFNTIAGASLEQLGKLLEKSNNYGLSLIGVNSQLLSEVLSRYSNILYSIKVLEIVSKELQDDNLHVETQTIVDVCALIGDFLGGKLGSTIGGTVGSVVGISVGGSIGTYVGGVYSGGSLLLPSAVVGSMAGELAGTTIGAGYGSYKGSQLGSYAGEKIGSVIADPICDEINDVIDSLLKILS